MARPKCSARGRPTRSAQGIVPLLRHGAARLRPVFDRPRVDEFDRWSFDRDRRAEGSASLRYVSPDVIGYEDLDAYGTWRSVSGLRQRVGPPARVEAGWAPYRDGHWAWVEPWGWTWVDDAPWGFAQCRTMVAGPILSGTLGMGARPCSPAGGLCPRAGRVRRRQQFPAFDLQRQCRRHQRGFRSGRATCTVRRMR